MLSVSHSALKGRAPDADRMEASRPIRRRFRTAKADFFAFCGADPAVPKGEDNRCTGASYKPRLPDKDGICIKIVPKRKKHLISDLCCGIISSAAGNTAVKYRGIAQLVESRSPKPLVVGSSPTAPAKTHSDSSGCVFLFPGKLRSSLTDLRSSYM